MKETERLADSGNEEARRLLRAARDVRIPADVQDDVRRAVEQRIGRNARRRWPLALAAAGVLVGATAAAQGLGMLDDLWGAIRETPSTAPRKTGTRAPEILPLESPAPLPPPPAPRPPPPRPRAGEKPARAIEQPGLDLPTLLRGADPEVVRPPPPRPGALVIARSGRGDVTLAVAGDAIRGEVRGTPVALTVGPTSVTGRLGGDAVLIHVFGTRQASGSVGGRELEFTFNPIERGWMVGAALPDVAGRVELDPARLQFRPGCNRPLAAVAGRPGVYAGTCADGAQLSITLPDGFLRLPPLTRLVVLGMLLPELESVLPESETGLFPRVSR